MLGWNEIYSGAAGQGWKNNNSQITGEQKWTCRHSVFWEITIQELIIIKINQHMLQITNHFNVEATVWVALLYEQGNTDLPRAACYSVSLNILFQGSEIVGDRRRWIQTVLLHRSPHLTAGEVKSLLFATLYMVNGLILLKRFSTLGNFAWSEIVCLRCFFAEWWLINTML